VSYDDLSRLTKAEVEKALAPLRRAHARIEAILKSGAATDFDTFQALTKKEALQQEMDRLEGELLKRVQGGAERMADATVKRAQQQAAPDAGPALGLSVDAGAVRRAQMDAASEVVGVSKSVRTALNVAVVDALTGASDRPAFEKAVRDAMGPDVLEHRVERIARTELSKAYMGQQAANDRVLARAPGVDLIKRWVKSGKGTGRSRPEHDAMHGQERELDEDFDMGGGATAATPPGGGLYRCAGPLDPRLPASMVVHCGCDVVRVAREEAQQAYISKEPRSVLAEAAEPAESAS
jgi:hypothetical protein